MKEWIEDIIKSIHLKENGDELLKEYLEADMTYKQCAEMLGCTPWTVRTRAVKLGLVAPKRWQKAEHELLKKYIKSGMTHEECAVKLGRKIKSVKQMAHALKHSGPDSIKNKKKSHKQSGVEMSNEQLRRLSKEEMVKACLNCTLPECINCFGADRRGKK